MDAANQSIKNPKTKNKQTEEKLRLHQFEALHLYPPTSITLRMTNKPTVECPCSIQ